ncbi:uncharacterized protein LOC128201146 [Galleria mellonella]|uniref:Uncharacterized protein LOC128201146 n=1 Tax=Galleria mellonella TaxID=7137 RepID=A0ABM3MP72_GALME|nr:uncharacterized protein LOC128201146 [Galleria mellonella]
MAKCGGCGRFLTTSDAVKCNNCHNTYHRACVALPVTGSVASSWQCPECKKNVVRNNKPDTPVRGPAHFVSHSVAPVESVAMDTSILDDSTAETKQDLNSEIIAELKIIKDELRAVRGEVQEFRAELIDVRASIKACHERMDNIDSRIEEMEKRLAALPSVADSPMSDIVEKLRCDLNERDQELLINDLEITNFPEEKGENPIHIVTQVATKLGVSLVQHDIVSAERVGMRRVAAAASEGVVSARPRPIAVRLARRDLRDDLLRGARVRRGADTADLGVSATPRPFYINERLTKYNRALFQKAREAGRRLGWRFVWTRRGRIYTRKDTTSSFHLLRSESDLVTVFGSK